MLLSLVLPMVRLYQGGQGGLIVVSLLLPLLGLTSMASLPPHPCKPTKWSSGGQLDNDEDVGSTAGESGGAKHDTINPPPPLQRSQCHLVHHPPTAVVLFLFVVFVAASPPPAGPLVVLAMPPEVLPLCGVFRTLTAQLMAWPRNPLPLGQGTTRDCRCCRRC